MGCLRCCVVCHLCCLIAFLLSTISCIYMFIKIIPKMISENSYTLQSSNTVYQLTISSENCTDKPHCIPQCNDLECRYLCRHMVKCSCLDYLHGHLCKHTHKVNPYNVHEYMHVYCNCIHIIWQVQIMHRRAQLTHTNIHKEDFSRDACIRDEIPNVQKIGMGHAL